jgi:uncharacterized protein
MANVAGGADSDAAAALLPAVQRPVVAIAALLLALVVWQAMAFGWRLPTLALIGAALGVALYFATFGFASAWRHMFTRGDTRGARMQILLLVLTMLIFAPVLAGGTFMGQAVAGAVAPAGVQVAVGAFLFGIGMQLGGGCASGTLYTAGSGNLRMAVTLAAFCAGAFWASLHLGFWTATPHLPAIALGDELGWPMAVGLQTGVLALVWLGLRRVGRKRAADKTAGPVPAPTLWHGPWPMAWGGIALALLNGATLVVANHPWAITWGYTLWGAKLAALADWQPVAGDIWSAGYSGAALAASPLTDTVSIMNIGILIGALLAVGLAGKFAPDWRIPMRSLAAALLGGLLLGYGARIAFGCNIGAFISGIASTSLHGWLWILCALPGNWVGIRLRPAFGLGVS